MIGGDRMNPCDNGVQPDNGYTHFMQPGHPFTLGEQQPDPRAEANAQAPVEE